MKSLGEVYTLNIYMIVLQYCKRVWQLVKDAKVGMI